MCGCDGGASFSSILFEYEVCSGDRRGRSSPESSELSMSTSSHDALVRCSQLLAWAITAGDMSATQAARPDTRSLNSVSFSHSSASALYT
ncbi:hypothetical protein EYF80_020709 [Liparis tanakae]|uniref:Uncharacterized protein n=1 Tax=Liparis tanakae TaxID=230148 RepID=A0A4Z2HT20_9TELE|nr:hypothetical protein EYF80_020709 [Liparis tanakae]